MTDLNHAVAVAMANGPAGGLALLGSLDDPRLAHDHRLHAARAHLLEMSGDRGASLPAGRHATNERHIRYLHVRTERLRGDLR